jgi:hypothetical protein
LAIFSRWSHERSPSGHNNAFRLCPVQNLDCFGSHSSVMPTSCSECVFLPHQNTHMQ